MSLLQLILILLARWRAVLLTFLLTVSVTVGISLLMPKTYTASASVLVDFKGGIDPITGMMLPGQMVSGYMNTQVDIITSRNVALKVVDALKLTESPDTIKAFHEATRGRGSIRHWLADAVVKNLSVKPSRDSSVINIAYSAPDPDHAAAMANAFAQSYIQTSLELKVEPARTQAAWFEDQLRNLQRNVEEARTRLSEYLQQTGIVASDERLDVENARLAELSSQLVVAQAQTYDSLTRQKQAAEAFAQGRLDELPDVQTNSMVQSLKSELARSEAKLAEAAEQLSRNHPKYQSLQAEVDKLKRKVAEEIQAVKSAIANAAIHAQRHEAEIEKALAEQKARVLKLKEQRDRVMLLTREVENAERTYDTAKQRTEQIRLESQRNQTEIALLNPAIPPLYPSKPRIFLNTVIAMVLGVLLGVGVGLLREVLDRRVRSEDDVDPALGIPLLASISGHRPNRWAWLINKAELPTAGLFQ
ncbi:chain length determinant protein EpsF [Methylocaldum szegediense]|uniref:Chain length determinant protein EpsF n=1 Tax=Methylocaldum szegediense TaxID=73780 RepID=A0ABM9I6Q8_9GAMM|nr:chain length determinant protein EpsF [Methylocaldum szegediense]CAI8925926.1 Chain length determinant protein EpsF [Methylocaldum szegediense]